MKTITITTPILQLVQLVPLVRASRPGAFEVPDKGELIGGWAPEEDEDRVEHEEDESFGHCTHAAYWLRTCRQGEGYSRDVYEVIEEIEQTGLKHGWLWQGENTLYLKAEFKGRGFKTSLAINFTYEGDGKTKRTQLDEARAKSLGPDDTIVISTNPDFPVPGILWRKHKLTRQWEVIKDELNDTLGDGTKRVYVRHLRKGAFLKEEWQFEMGVEQTNNLYRFNNRNGLWRQNQKGYWRYAGRDFDLASELMVGREKLFLAKDGKKYEVSLDMLRGMEMDRVAKLKRVLATMK